MQTNNVRDWGSDTLQACRDIVKARRDGVDILIHEGDIDTHSDHNLSTISNACVDSEVELVIKGAHDPGAVFPHITFIEET